MLKLLTTLAKPLPALASIATIAALYFAWSAVHETQLSRIDQRKQFLAEKAPRLEPIRVFASENHVLIELKNEGESDARHVGVAKGFIRTDGSSISDWEFTAANATLQKGETKTLYVADLEVARTILGYVPSEFDAKRFAKPQSGAGVLQVAINYQDAYGNPIRREVDYVVRP